MFRLSRLERFEGHRNQFGPLRTGRRRHEKDIIKRGAPGRKDIVKGSCSGLPANAFKTRVPEPSNDDFTVKSNMPIRVSEAIKYHGFSEERSQVFPPIRVFLQAVFKREGKSIQIGFTEQFMEVGEPFKQDIFYPAFVAIEERAGQKANWA